MGRGKTVIKHSEVMRAARGLLEAAKAAGASGDIEVYLETGVVRFHMNDSSAAVPALSQETSENLRKLL
jgi:hypothetical protein